MTLQEAKELLATRRALASLDVTFEPVRRFPTSDYALLDHRLERFEQVFEVSRHGERITVYALGPKQKLAVFRHRGGPQFVVEHALLANTYVADVLSDLLRHVVIIASERQATGYALIDFVTGRERARIGRLSLRPSTAGRQTLALDVEITTTKRLEARSFDFGDLFSAPLAHFFSKNDRPADFNELSRFSSRRSSVEYLSSPLGFREHLEIERAAASRLKALRKAAELKVKQVRKAIDKQVDVKEAGSTSKDALNSSVRSLKKATKKIDSVAAAGPMLDPTKPHPVDVFFATDRKRTGSNDPLNFYGFQPARELTLGICRVTIPPVAVHQLGRVEKPKIWKLQFRPNPKKHVVLTTIKELEETSFYRSLRKASSNSNCRQVFIFVHGYNVTFADALKRTAQIHADINFAGAPILYSWPSRGTLSGYGYDSERVKATREHFAQFVCDVWRKSGIEEIHIVAHSMGNRVVASALESIGLDAAVNPKPPMSQIVLAAPDLDVDDFSIAVSRMNGLGKRVTLYGSSRDKAIRASKKFLYQQLRAGEGGHNLVVIQGIDSVDASLLNTDFLSHSYIADSSRLLADMHALVSDNTPPAERFGIVARSGGGWMFEKQRY
jgi:esterase/lipase superfamily enzyme